MFPRPFGPPLHFASMFSVQVQNIGNTFGQRAAKEALMPWKKSEPMEQRVEFVLRALRTENFRALCQEYGISSKTGYKWQERFLRLGLSGMEEESRRPHSHAEQLGE